MSLTERKVPTMAENTEKTTTDPKTAVQADVKNEEESTANYAWVLLAKATDIPDEESSLIENMLANEDPDIYPTCAQLGELIDHLMAEHATDGTKHTKKLPSLRENFWDEGREVLLCFEQDLTKFEVWQRRTLA